LIGAAFTEIAGSSKYYFGGVIAYDNSIKKKFLEVSSEILDTHGAVSSQTALAMVLGVKKLMRTDCAISTTGIAGPGGGTPVKPVGLVYIGISVGETSETYRIQFSGSRDQIRQQTVQTALDCLFTMLLNRA
jgi:PncC family amidohydrolase